MAEQRDLSLSTVFTANVSQFQAGVKAVKAQMASLNAEMARGATRAAKPMTALAQSQKLYASRVGEMAKVNNSYKSALDGVIKSTDGTARSQQNAIKYMDRMQQMVNKQSRSLQAAGKDGAKFAKEIDYVNLVAKDQAGLLQKTANGFNVLSQATKKAAKSQSFIGKQIAQVEGAMARLGAAMKVTAAYGVAATSIYMVVDALKGGVDEIVAYDQALKNLQAITGATDAEIRVMGETIKQVARNTKFSMTETADAMVLLGQAGFDAGESIDAIDASAMLATGTLSNMQTVTDLMTTAVRAFGLEASQAGQISDIMANAVNKSKLTIDKLRIAMNYVGPAAYAVGAELEEVAASMMVLANSGLRASTIGTGLRQVFARLVAPSAKLRQAFEEHNIELEDLNVQTHGFTGVLRNLGEVFVDAETGAMDAQKAFELFGLRGANSILALMRGINSGEFQTALDHVYEVGTAANMAGIQIEGLALQFKNLTDRFKSLMVELGNRGFTDVLQGFLEVLRQLVIALTAFVEKGLGDSLTVYATFITTVGAATVAVMALGKAVVWLTRKFIVFSAAMLTHPIGIMIFAVGALAAAYKRFQGQLTKNLHAYQSEIILGQKRVDVLQSYMRRLKEAHDAAEKDQSQMKKYTSLVKRLKTEFSGLAGQVDGAGDNFEELHQILKDEAFNSWFNSVSASIDALAEGAKVLESTKASAGWVERASAGASNYAKNTAANWQSWIEAAARVDPITMGIVKSFKELSEIGNQGIAALDTKFDDVNESAKVLGAETEKGIAAQKAFDDLVVKTSNDMLFGYQRGVVTIQQMSENVTFLFGKYDQLSDPLKVFVKALERAIELAKELDALREKKPVTYAKMESPFEKMISDSKGFQQVELLNIKRSMDQAISAYKDKAKKEGIITEEAEKNKAAIRMNYMLKAFDILDKEDDITSARYDKQISYLTEFKNRYIDHYDELIEAEEIALEKNKKLYEEGSKDRIKIEKDAAKAIESFALAKVGTIEGVEQQITDITRKAIVARSEFDVTKKTREVDTHFAEQESIINGMSNSRIISEKQATNEIAKIQKQHAANILAIHTTNFEMIKKSYGEGTTAYQEALDAQLQAYLKYMEASDELDADDKQNFMDTFQEKFAMADEYYHSGEISQQEFYDWLQLAREEDLISEEEYQERKAILMGNYFAVFKRGLRNASRQVKSFGEMFYDMATELPEMLATGFTEAFMSVVEGSETFGEAMEMMFKELLAWIGQTILQLLIMQALMKVMGIAGGAIGGTGGAEASGGAVGAGGNTTLGTGWESSMNADFGMVGMHKGGIVGKEPTSRRRVNPLLFVGAPRLHEGFMPLKQNEKPTIINKDEGVFTPGQMKALGGNQSSISVPVNVEYSNPRLTNALRQNIEEAVQKTLRQELR